MCYQLCQNCVREIEMEWGSGQEKYYVNVNYLLTGRRRGGSLLEYHAENCL
jgi:hypothetical protein